MAEELTVVLTAAQMKSLKEHAAKKKRTPENDLVHVWWHRVCALADYSEKLEKGGSKFRTHLPKFMEDGERDRLRAQLLRTGKATRATPKPAPEKQKRVIKEAVKPETVLQKLTRKNPILRDAIRGRPAQKTGRKGARQIDLYDSDDAALAKAGYLSEDGHGTVASILKAAGRDSKGAVKK